MRYSISIGLVLPKQDLFLLHTREWEKSGHLDMDSVVNKRDTREGRYLNRILRGNFSVRLSNENIWRKKQINAISMF